MQAVLPYPKGTYLDLLFCWPSRGHQQPNEAQIKQVMFVYAMDSRTNSYDNSTIP